MLSGVGCREVVVVNVVVCWARFVGSDEDVGLGIPMVRSYWCRIGGGGLSLRLSFHLCVL